MLPTRSPRDAILRAVLAAPRTLALALITLYRGGISPFLGSNCRFVPTCSAYAEEAIRRHGFIAGAGLAAKRLAKCHPITWLGGASGFDPVPEPRSCQCRPAGSTDHV